MIRILYRHRSTGIVAELPVEQLQTAVQDKLLNLWIDMLAPTETEWKLVLERTFRFHPLAIEDAIQDLHVPKLDDYGSYLFVVIHTVSMGDEPMDLDSDEVDIFLGANYIITMHDKPRISINHTWQMDFQEGRGLARGPAFVLYEILDRQVDGFIPILDEFEAHLEELGDVIFRSDSQQGRALLLNDILTAKSSALRLRRILIPQRELVNRLAMNEYGVIPHDMRIYFRDVYDHMVRLADLSDGMRDLAGSTIETHLALANNRMNEIVKLLTIISTIFIPLSFVAGVYGMNFEFMPELHWRYGYLFVWAIFLTIAISLLVAFWRRGWLNSGDDGTLDNLERRRRWQMTNAQNPLPSAADSGVQAHTINGSGALQVQPQMPPGAETPQPPPAQDA